MVGPKRSKEMSEQKGFKTFEIVVKMYLQKAHFT